MSSWAKSRAHHMRPRPVHSTELPQYDIGSLGEDQLRVSASTADVGMLPVPPEAGIDFAVVTSNASEAQNHTAQKPEAQKKKDRN